METMTMSTMMGAMPESTMGMDMMSMQECVEACNAAATAATMCADADTGADMARCSSTCMNMADVATTMMRMMMRPMGHDAMVMKAMLEASVAMCQGCMDACAEHADMHECCRVCMMACENMMAACTSMMSRMA
ncbi:aldehyde dehydrogenase [Microbacterium sp. 18062]|uniref:aldehyde dehydrogenase n=1 Tax=Microbacterium sp. 18062 TaxID=2681410 RepID=UPI00135C03B1|nr:aldehyde dehydrogenase [Microbacterium sp. 18062]